MDRTGRTRKERNGGDLGDRVRGRIQTLSSPRTQTCKHRGGTQALLIGWCSLKQAPRGSHSKPHVPLHLVPHPFLWNCSQCIVSHHPHPSSNALAVPRWCRRHPSHPLPDPSQQSFTVHESGSRVAHGNRCTMAWVPSLSLAVVRYFS